MYLQSMTATFSHTLWYTAGTVLTIDDLREVCEAVWSVRSMWETIGLVLGLRMGDLHAVKGDYRDVDHCLTQMICMWLRSDRRLTWESLIAALRAAPVDADELARDIEEKYVQKTTGMWGVKYIIPLPQAIDRRMVFCS